MTRAGTTAARGALPALPALLALLALPAPARAQPVDYELTPTHSFVHFEWDHGTISTVRGRFDKLAGRVTLDRGAGQGRATVTLRLDSINTGRPALDAALRQAFAAASGGPAEEDRPLALALERLAVQDGQVRGGEVRFAWRGQPQQVRLQAQRFNCYLNPLLRREVCGGDFHGELDPAALGLGDAGFGLAGPIRLRVQIEAIRQEAGS